MGTIKTNVNVQICGGGNAWKVATSSDPTGQVTTRLVLLEIQGDSRDGYHLVMSPEGCFTADTWHEKKREALDAAHELFGVEDDEWSDT